MQESPPARGPEHPDELPVVPDHPQDVAVQEHGVHGTVAELLPRQLKGKSSNFKLGFYIFVHFVGTCSETFKIQIQNVHY